MPQARTLVRNAVVDALTEFYPETIYKKRDPDLTDGEDAAIAVYLSEGEVVTDGMQQNTVADLVVAFHRKDLIDDDDLDEWSKRASHALAQLPATSVITGIQPSGFEYGDIEEGQYYSLYLKFNVVYQRY